MIPTPVCRSGDSVGAVSLATLRRNRLLTFGYAEPKERVTVVLQVRVYTKGSSDYGVKEGLRSTRGVLRGGDLPLDNY